MFLDSLLRQPDHARDPARFPWSLPLLRDLDRRDLASPVTFLDRRAHV
jgi:predicted ATPase